MNYDIKVVSMDLTIDLEAQIGINSKEKNEYGEYIYDVSRGFYYLSLLHSKSYEYKEKGYRKKRSKVIFIYKYDNQVRFEIVNPYLFLRDTHYIIFKTVFLLCTFEALLYFFYNISNRFHFYPIFL